MGREPSSATGTRGDQGAAAVWGSRNFSALKRCVKGDGWGGVPTSGNLIQTGKGSVFPPQKMTLEKWEYLIKN